MEEIRCAGLSHLPPFPGEMADITAWYDVEPVIGPTDAAAGKQPCG